MPCRHLLFAWLLLFLHPPPTCPGRVTAGPGRLRTGINSCDSFPVGRQEGLLSIVGRGLRGGGVEEEEGSPVRVFAAAPPEVRDGPTAEELEKLQASKLRSEEDFAHLEKEYSQSEADETDSRMAAIITENMNPESSGDDDASFMRKIASALPPPAPPSHAPGDGASRLAGAGRTGGSQNKEPPPTLQIRPWSPEMLESLGAVLPGSEESPSRPDLVLEQQLKGAGSEIKEGEWTLKTALSNATVHGTRLELLPGCHGPFNTLHSYPEEHDEGRVWADTLVMKAPCHIIGNNLLGGEGRAAGGQGRMGEGEGGVQTHVEATGGDSQTSANCETY